MPPAEFSPLTITRSGAWRSRSAGIAAAQPPPPGAADHVADEEDPHRALTLSARLSAMADSAKAAAILTRALELPLRGARALLPLPRRRGSGAAAGGGPRPQRPHRRCSPTAPTPRPRRSARKLAAAARRRAAGAAGRARGLRRRLLRPRLPLRSGAGDAGREPGDGRPGLRPASHPTAEQLALLDRERAELRPGRGSDGVAGLPQQARLPARSTAPRWRSRRCARRDATLPELDEPAILERVADWPTPIVRTCVDCGGISRSSCVRIGAKRRSDRREAAQREAGDAAVGDDQDRQVQQRAADPRPASRAPRSSPPAPA